MEEVLCAMALKSSNGRQTHHTQAGLLVCCEQALKGVGERTTHGGYRCGGLRETAAPPRERSNKGQPRPSGGARRVFDEAKEAAKVAAKRVSKEAAKEAARPAKDAAKEATRAAKEVAREAAMSSTSTVNREWRRDALR